MFIPAYKKYVLIESDQDDFYRVQATRNFANVKKGEIGGYVRREDNLSHEGNSWIGEGCYVYGGIVTDNAVLSGKVRITGDHTVISGNSIISGRALIFDSKIKDSIITVTGGLFKSVRGSLWRSHFHLHENENMYIGDWKQPIYTYINDCILKSNVTVASGVSISGIEVAPTDRRVEITKDFYKSDIIKEEIVVNSNDDLFYDTELFASYISYKNNIYCDVEDHYHSNKTRFCGTLEGYEKYCKKILSPDRYRCDYLQKIDKVKKHYGI